MAAPIIPRDRPAFRVPLGMGDIASPCAPAAPDGKTINMPCDGVALEV